MPITPVLITPVLVVPVPTLRLSAGSAVVPDDLEQHEASTTTEARTQASGGGTAVEDFFSTDDIFRRVLATAAHELERPASTFIWGSLAAGLIVGFSLSQPAS